MLTFKRLRIQGIYRQFRSQSYRHFASSGESKYGIPFAGVLSLAISAAGFSHTALNSFNAYDLWKNRREDRLKAIVEEAVDYTYQVFVNELKKKGCFDKDKQQEAMRMVYDYVQQRVGPAYSNQRIKVLAEERLLYIKSKQSSNSSTSQQTYALVVRKHPNDKIEQEIMHDI